MAYVEIARILQYRRAKQSPTVGRFEAGKKLWIWINFERDLVLKVELSEGQSSLSSSD
jgi:hypothetical protein